MLTLALYQPEIAANLGAAIRIAACFGARLAVIEPCGFPWKTRNIDRVSLDYGRLAQPVRFPSWESFRSAEPGRLVLLTTKASESYAHFAWAPGDILLMGQESAGVPDEIHHAADARVVIPLAPDARSLNVAVAAGMTLSEARRQIGWEEIGATDPSS